MPTYEYECTQCGRRFEVFQSIKAKPHRKLDTDCDRCDHRAPVRRLIGAGGGLLFKGSGFYQTDYRSESYKKAAEADKPSTDGKKDDGAKKDAGKAASESQSAESPAASAKSEKPKSKKRRQE